MASFHADTHWITLDPDPAPPTVRSLRRHRRGRHVAVPQLTNPLAPSIPAPVLLPIIGENDEILPAVEERLHPIALRAKSGDKTARNGLYAAFEPKLRRIARRLSIPHTAPGDTPVWDRDDIYQETFIVFTELLATWPETIPIARYILANIPWRLRDAIYRGIGRRTTPPRTTAVDLATATTITDPASVDDETRAILRNLGRHLTPLQQDILYRHIVEGATLTAIAESHGLARRTITRHWRAARLTLAHELDPPH